MNGLLLRKGSSAILIRFLSAALGFGLIFLMSQWMSAEEFGRFGFAFSLATTVALVTDLGQQRLILRSIAAYRERGRGDLLRAVLRFSLGVSALGALIAAIVIGVFAAVTDLGVSAVGVSLLAIAMLFADFQSNALRALGSLVRALVPREIVWRPISIGILVAIGGGIAITVDANSAIWALALTLFTLNLLQFVSSTLPRLKSALSAAQDDDSEDVENHETVEMARLGWRASSLRLWAVSAMNSGMLPLSVVVVGLFVSEAQTGAFFAAVRIATVIAFPLQGLNLLTGPMLARAYAARDSKKLQEVASFTALWSTLVGLASVVLIAIFGEFLLGLLNKEFVQSTATLLVVIVGFVVAAMCGSSGQLMNMTGHDREFLRILLVANPIGFACLVFLSYLYGGIGAAFGLLILKSGWNLAVVFWARKHLGLDPSIAAFVAPPRERAI